jgi:hypothetical protein
MKPQKRKQWVPAPYGAQDNPGVFDTGNGALMFIERNEAFPGLERVEIRSYCGRPNDNRLFYRLASDHTAHFISVKGARRYLRDCEKIDSVSAAILIA